MLQRLLQPSNDVILVKSATAADIYMETAFEIPLGTRQLPRLLLKEICIFSNLRRQIIAEAKVS